MLELVKAPRAEADLIDIWPYIAEDQPINADHLLDRLNDAALLIADTLEMGVDRSVLFADIKKFPVDNYIVFYRVKPNTLELVRELSASKSIASVSW